MIEDNGDVYLSFATKKTINQTDNDFSIPDEVSHLISNNDTKLTTAFLTIPTEVPLVSEMTLPDIPVENSGTFSKEEITKFQPSFPVTKSPEGTFEARHSVESNSVPIPLNINNDDSCKVKESYKSPEFGYPN